MTPRHRTAHPPQFAPQPLFVARVVEPEYGYGYGGPLTHPEYAFEEVLMGAGGSLGPLAGLRYGKESNPGVSVTGHRFAAGDLAFARTADGAGGLKWELYPLPGACRTTATVECLVPGPYGWPVGIAVFETHCDGRARCVVKGFCEPGCDPAVSPPPPPPPTTNAIAGEVNTGSPDFDLVAGAVLTLGGSAGNTGTFTTGPDGLYSFTGLTAGSTIVTIGGTVDPALSAYNLDAAGFVAGSTVTFTVSTSHDLDWHGGTVSPPPPPPPPPFVED
jgi:hypothetical protein